MTPLHHAIKGALLPVLLVNTQAARGDKVKVTDEKVKALHEWFNGQTSRISSDYMVFTSEVLARVLDRPDLVWHRGKENMFNVAVPVVIVPEKNETGHDHLIGKPAILVNAKKGYYISRKDGAWSMQRSEVRFATDEEVEQCVDELNETQLRNILVNAHLTAVLHPLFSEMTELVVAPTDESDEE